MSSVTRKVYPDTPFIDVIIVEDDPYYFLQEGEYTPKESRAEVTHESDEEKFIASLSPSFLKYACPV